jgi:hypothetical protein
VVDRERGILAGCAGLSTGCEPSGQMKDGLP